MYSPPTGMVVNPTAQVIITAIQFAAAAAITIWVFYGRDKQDVLLRLLVLLGGGLSVLFEPLGDHMGFI